MNPITLLERTDKHYLGGGNRVVWTPTFPVYLDRPGFWDFASYYNFRVEPIFSFCVLNEEGFEFPLEKRSRNWNPARLEQDYLGDYELYVKEQKMVLPEDTLVSRVTIQNRAGRTRIFHWILFTALRSFPSGGKEFVDNLDLLKDRIIFTRFLQYKNLPLYGIHCSLGLNLPPDSYAVYFSEPTELQPRWNLTPFFDRFENGTLPNEIRIEGISQDGIIYIALHKKFRLLPGEKKTFWAACALASSDEEASAHLDRTLKGKDPLERSIENWKQYFSSLPQFRCSDPFFERYYWYRWFGLRLFAIQGGGEANYPHSAICEGPDYFRVPITYSAQCHMMETRWMSRPDFAQGSLLNFIHVQNPDGSFTGHIYPNATQKSGFYHANWGRALFALWSNHPDRSFLEEAYPGLVKYAEYFDRERDREDSGLYDVLDQFETGQEFTSRYLAVDEKADQYGWENKIRLKGVDATVYQYELRRALAFFADLMGKENDKKRWEASAEKIKNAVLKYMWDNDEEMFFDVDPRTMQRTGVKAITCFYPYMTDIVDEQHLNGLKRHLLNPDEFWTPWPVPTLSVDDPYFSPNAEWKGKRHNCPWNGRVWPMTNSHILEALATCARRFQAAVFRMRN